MQNNYGTLDYSPIEKTWSLKDPRGDGISLPINLREGDVIRLGVLQGKEVKAVLLKDFTGGWVWCVNEIHAQPEVGGFVALESRLGSAG